ncbi:hypothetical protein L195_g054381 [Trifolium pratense]|uniref:Uncharacterized protein n=1 Tax=Trifolium pratense TaxID=57577 RepID=A0A2K3KFQ7_TRIPR|nr:hypothetical protein L195_g054381 [Trifolium pratense]
MMREKVERDALPRASGAVRLPEFETERRDGYVNHLNQETTSFFFTNIPDDFKVMDLWAEFAKHGRVAEVYKRFGFMKKNSRASKIVYKRLE